MNVISILTSCLYINNEVIEIHVYIFCAVPVTKEGQNDRIVRDFEHRAMDFL